MFFNRYKNQKKNLSRSSTKVGRFGPVYVRKDGDVISFREKKWKIEFTKTELVGWIGGHVRRVIALAVLAVAGIIAFVAIPGSARIATFHPQTCLGGWENPSFAEGSPDVLSGSEYNTFSSENSAMNRDTSADIFCGDFKGPIPEGGSMQTAVLSFSVYVGDIEEQSPGVFVPVESVQQPTPIPPDETTTNTSEQQDAPPSSPPQDPNTTIIEGGLIENFYDILDAPEGNEVQLTSPEDPVSPVSQDQEPAQTPEETTGQNTNIPAEGSNGTPPAEGATTPQENTQSSEVPATAEPPAPEQNPVTEEVVSWLYRALSSVFSKEQIAYATTTPDGAGDVSAQEQPAPVLPQEPPAQGTPNDPTAVVTPPDAQVPEEQKIFDEYAGEQTPEPTDGQSGVQNDQVITGETNEPPISNDNVTSQAPVSSGDKLFAVEYSFNGVDWIMLGEVSLHTWHTASFQLPFVSWENIGDMQVRLVRPASFDAQPTILLDAITLEVNYANDKKQRGLLQRESKLMSFKTSDDLSFEFTYHVKKENGFKKVMNEVAPVFPLDREFSITKTEVRSVTGELVDVETQLDLGLADTWKVVIPKNKRTLRPGKYTFEITTQNVDGETFTETREFYWGVLTINTNKSIFEPNEEAFVQMGVLDDMGHTLCDATIELEIQDPTGTSEIFSILDNTILKSGVCVGDSVVDVPDYSARYTVGGAGTYQMRLINLDNGFEILDSFEVRDSVPFVVERVGPTRIFPPATYEMKIMITAKQDFNGVIYEYIPDTFTLSDITGSISTTSPETSSGSIVFVEEKQSDEPGTKELLWNGTFTAGESATLRYVFDAPDISPEVFLLGPLEFYE